MEFACAGTEPEGTGFFPGIKPFYRDTRPLWEVDFSWEGFSWIANDDYTQSVIAFRRFDASGNEVLVICNFLPVARRQYRIGVPYAGVYTEIFSTDAEAFGGSGEKVCDAAHSEPVPMHGQAQSLGFRCRRYLSLSFPARRIRKRCRTGNEDGK